MKRVKISRQSFENSTPFKLEDGTTIHVEGPEPGINIGNTGDKSYVILFDGPSGGGGSGGGKIWVDGYSIVGLGTQDSPLVNAGPIADIRTDKAYALSIESGIWFHKDFFSVVEIDGRKSLGIVGYSYYSDSGSVVAQASASHVHLSKDDMELHIGITAADMGTDERQAYYSSLPPERIVIQPFDDRYTFKFSGGYGPMRPLRLESFIII